MWSLVWLAVFGTICSAATGVDQAGRMSSSELMHFNVGDFQGLFYASHMSRHIDNASFVPAKVANKSMDVMLGEFAMVYRNTRLYATPARNVSLATYKLTGMMVEGDNCHGFDFDLSLVSLVKLSGHVQGCFASTSSWSLVSKPCISVFGFSLGCTDINLSSDNVKYCWDLNVALAKASICANVKDSCLRFNGEGCYYSFPGWSCKDFDAEAKCW